MIEKLTELVRQLAALPNTRAEITTFPSGAVTLDVWRGEKLFVLQYFPAHQCFGVDEVTEENSFLVSCEFVAKELEPATQRLWQLVQGNDREPGKAEALESMNGERKDPAEPTSPKSRVQ